jgi:serine/threonine protein kinase
LTTVIRLETVVGHVVGSPPYMSPEQARGQDVDERTDIWAFGCVLYEMLTGTRAFQGEMLADTITAVLERQPDWRVLPKATPASIRELLRRCLDKAQTRRLHKIADARKTIERTQNRWGESPGGISPPGARRTVLERLRSYGSHHLAAGRTPNADQWANSRGSRRATPPSQCSARRRCPRRRLYFRMAQRTRSSLRWRKTGYNADR